MSEVKSACVGAQRKKETRRQVKRGQGRQIHRLGHEE